MRISFYLKRLLIFIGMLVSDWGFYVLLKACIWSGVSADTTIIFYILSNFRDLKRWLAESIPFGLGHTSDFLSSYKRICQMLEVEELQDCYKLEITDKPMIDINECTVKIRNKTICDNISFKITSGLTVITGKIGSGKSSLLKMILKDLPMSSGLMKIRGRVSYASQDPWLFPSSIKQNILFGESYNEKRYQEVVRICALSYDFNALEKGDETLLSDRGLNLSKGQQARINLARAMYKESEIYLLDDCLTALDASVQDYIFKECIKIFLRDKICLLVSQTAQHIQEADQIIVLKHGYVKHFGAPNEHILKEHSEEYAEDNDDGSSNSIDESEVDEKTSLLRNECNNNATNLYKEDIKRGSVSFKVYKMYVVYGGGLLLFLINIFTKGVAQFTMSFSDKLLTTWVDKKQKVLMMEQTFYNSSASFTLLENAQEIEHSTFMLYTVMIMLTFPTELLSSYLLIDFCRKASNNLHKVMVNNVTNAVMTFFDTHLFGNILNRFSQDMVNVDENLTFVIYACLKMLFTAAGILIIVISINYYFAICTLVILTALFFTRKLYLPAGRNLKRLESSSRSPMIGHLNATLDGLTTIRAFNVQRILTVEFDRYQDLYTSASYLCLCMTRAFFLVTDTIGSFFIIFLIIRFMLFDKETSAGDVGLALILSNQLIKSLGFGFREWSNLETTMTSVERILEYADVKTEPKTGVVLKNWPTDGGIKYENVSFSYNNKNTVILKNLNFEIKPKEKIGIVGRTGAGKSSIISTIFCLYQVEGRILIDGVDNKLISLDTLRKNISVIPQDPILFSGSIRENLDPYKEFSDADLWSALERVNLKKRVSSLDQMVTGSNQDFSSGEKQLICLCRAILRRNKIVIMDEATANMDENSDIFLHKIVEEIFADCTIITVAHRLHSVLKCDRVMVLNKGEIVEFDDPNNLLEDPNGLFYKMVQQAGLLNYLN